MNFPLIVRLQEHWMSESSIYMKLLGIVKLAGLREGVNYQSLQLYT